MSWKRKATEKKTREYGPRTIDSSCRNDGDCPWCRGNRTFSTKKRMSEFDEKDLDKFKEMWYDGEGENEYE
jgi:hypothetical protein